MKILVLDVPALHLGYLGCYGNDWVATPNIDRLAGDSIVFDRHFFDTTPGHPLAMTGHCHFPQQPEPVVQPAATLDEVLTQHRLERVFLEAEDRISQHSLKEIVAQTTLALTQGRPFTWVRFPSMAPPWNLPADLLDSYCEEEDEPWPDPPPGALVNGDDVVRLQNTYAAVVTYVDAQLGVLFEQLGQTTARDDTLICLTASIGLPLGEHGIVGFTKPWLHEELVHLPLLMRLPGAEAGGTRVDALTQPVDLFPTFLESLGVAAPAGHGHSLWPLLRGAVTEIRPFACSGWQVGQALEWSLRSPRWALLLPVSSSDDARTAQLFVKPEDRWEVNDVHQHHQELVEEMTDKLRAAILAFSRPIPLPPHVKAADHE